MLRKLKCLPAHVVEDHHEVVPILQRYMGARQFPLLGSTLVHFDSHPDLLAPQDMPADSVWEKDVLLDYISIESWVLPMCYAGHFTTVVWVRPPWCEQIPLGEHEVLVGRHREGGGIGVCSELYYFLSDGIVFQRDQLENTQLLRLVVIDEVQCSTLLDKIDGHYVLDVDLDYFSTCNPFLEMYSEGGLYQKLKPLFSFDVGESVFETAKQRRQQLDALKVIFKRLEEGKDTSEETQGLSETQQTALKEVLDTVQQFYVPGIDFAILLNAGMTCDRTELPQHIATDEELRGAFDRLQGTLGGAARPPTIITVARSSSDDYCPPLQVDFIQKSVLQVLQKVFNNVSVSYDYEPDR